MRANTRRCPPSRCRSRALAGLGALLLAACGGEPATPAYHADETPTSLSDWGQLSIEGGVLQLAEGVEPYALATPLFSDYAGKLRTVWTPAGAARYEPEAVFDFPVGTVITKTFYYPENVDGTVERVREEGAPHLGLDLGEVRLVETRLLVRREAGWLALPYVWNTEETDAILKPVGAAYRLAFAEDGAEPTEFAYLVPNRNQCAGCHAVNNTTRALSPIGPKARHLNRDLAYADGAANQLGRWVETGLLEDAPNARPRSAFWTDAAEPLEARARAYLEINCAHCHNPVGPADTSGLYLDEGTPFSPAYGLCKLPIAAAQGTGGRKHDIVPGDPDASILHYRMASDNPAEMMPELGRSTVHAEGVALVRAWIAALDGAC
ncbi:MAG: SO2930 family diheme c-type cytochrome [Pseudomonadota bacterium]